MPMLMQQHLNKNMVTPNASEQLDKCNVKEILVYDTTGMNPELFCQVK
jgi:hypothetical protein